MREKIQFLFALRDDVICKVNRLIGTQRFKNKESDEVS